MEREKIKETMWCRNCDHKWETEDYFNTNACPNCGHTQIYRTSSFSFFYAYLEAHPENKPKI